MGRKWKWKFRCGDIRAGFCRRGHKSCLWRSNWYFLSRTKNTFSIFFVEFYLHSFLSIWRSKIHPKFQINDRFSYPLQFFHQEGVIATYIFFFLTILFITELQHKLLYWPSYFIHTWYRAWHVEASVYSNIQRLFKLYWHMTNILKNQLEIWCGRVIKINETERWKMPAHYVGRCTAALQVMRTTAR